TKEDDVFEGLLIGAVGELGLLQTIGMEVVFDIPGRGSTPTSWITAVSRLSGVASRYSFRPGLSRRASTNSSLSDSVRGGQGSTFNRSSHTRSASRRHPSTLPRDTM